MPLKFNLEENLQEQGYKLKDMKSPSVAIIEDGAGNQKEMDIASNLKDAGYNLKDVEISVNSPDTAIATSPLSAEDRHKMSVGNSAGIYKYLKSRYQDVSQDSNGDWVIKKNNAWSKADPGLGDILASGNPYEITKEISKDIIDVIPQATEMIAEYGTAAAAAIVSKMPTASIGAGKLAAALAIRGRNSLGRMYGTYEADDATQVKDELLESMINIGGEFVAPAAKLGANQFKNAMKSVSDNATPVVKEILSKVFETTSGKPAKSFNVFFNNVDEVTKKMVDIGSEISKKGLPVTDEAINTYVQDVEKNSVKSLIGNYPKVISKEYSNLLESSLSSKEISNFKINLGEISSDAMSKLEQLNIVEKTNDGLFKLVDENKMIKDLANLSSADSNLVKGLLDKDLSSLRNLVTLSNENVKNNLGVEVGKSAAQKAIKYRQFMDSVYSDLTKYDNPVSDAFETQMRKPWFDSRAFLTKAFDEAGGVASENWNKANKLWADTVNSREIVNKLKYKIENPRTFTQLGALDNIVDSISKGKVNKIDFLDEISKATGDKGLIKEVQLLNSAKDMLSITPTTKNMVGAGAVLTATGNVPAAAGLLASGSPRLIAKGTSAAVKSARAIRDVVSSLPKQDRLGLLQNPEQMIRLFANYLQPDNSSKEPIK